MKKSKFNLVSVLKAFGITPQFLIISLFIIFIFGIGLGLFFKNSYSPKKKVVVVETEIKEPTEATVPKSENDNQPLDIFAELSNTPFVKNAVIIDKEIKTPVVAIIIDDMGIDMLKSRQILEFNLPFNVSFLTYAPNIQSQIDFARKSGKEIMLHVPMQALHDNYDYGGDYLSTDKSRFENLEILNTQLNKAKGYIGINNHMGSKFTADMAQMTAVMEELTKRGLAFIDSKTNSESKGDEIASFLKLPYVARDVFLDDSNKEEDIIKSLIKLETIAKKRGYAVAIGHPRKNTIKILKQWFDTISQRGIEIVPISYIIKNYR